MQFTAQFLPSYRHVNRRWGKTGGGEVLPLHFQAKDAAYHGPGSSCLCKPTMLMVPVGSTSFHTEIWQDLLE